MCLHGVPDPEESCNGFGTGFPRKDHPTGTGQGHPAGDDRVFPPQKVVPPAGRRQEAACRLDIGAARDGGEVARLAERAIAPYRGTFFSGETFCSGIVPYRERLRSKFLRTAVQAGRHWEQAGEWEKAITCYQKGLEIDPLSEGMFRGLISCNVRMGRVAEAHAVYHRCRKTLSSELGVSPSPDLQAMLPPAAPAPVRK